MTSAGSRILGCLLAGLIASVSASPRSALGSGFRHGSHHGYVTTTTTNGVLMPAFGTSSVLMPMGVTMPMVQTTTGVRSPNGALLPASVMPAGVSTNIFTAGVPGYYVTSGVSAGSQPLVGGSPSATTAPALLPNALGTASVTPASTGEFRTEYNAFVQGENALSPAGVNLAPADVQQFGTTFASLSGAVGGPRRLASIGRFLRTKLTDPNFDAKALDLFSWAIGAANPGLAAGIGAFRPAIDQFTGQLRQGAGGANGAKPAPIPDANAAAPANPFNNGNAPLRVLVTFENAPPARSGGPVTSSPAPVTAATPLDTIKKVAEAMGATVVSEDANGITLKTSDGRPVSFDATGKPVPPTD